MGGIDTRGRYHVHWGAPETYGERREESALRRSGRTVPDPAYRPFAAVDLARARRGSSTSTTTTRREMLAILEATQAAYGYLPVAALKRISQRTGAWYAMIYGTATLLQPPALRAGRGDRSRPRRSTRTGRPRATYLAALDAALAGARRSGAASRRGRDPMVEPPQDAQGLAGDPARAGRRRGSDRPRRGRAGGRVRRPAARRSATSARPRRSPRSPRRACAAAAAPASRPRRSGAWPPARTPRAATSWPTATARTRRPARTDFLIERDPFAVIEGAAIAAFAIGAGEVIIAVRAEATEAIARLECGDRRGRGGGLHRLRRPRAPGTTSRSRSGRSRAPTCSARRRSCSRRSRASAASPSSGRRTRPSAACSTCRPSSTTSRPWRPSRGSSATAPTAFAAIGTPDSPGTILVQVRTPAGDGIAEVPLGTPLRDDRRARRHGCRPAARSRPSSSAARRAACSRRTCSTRPYDFEALRAAGAHIGSGSVVVADDRACIVDLARLLTRFCAGEACGKTIPCRIGTRRLVEIADRVVEGRPRPTDTDPARGPVGRHRRLRPVRPRAPDDPPARERDAILPVRAGRAHPPQRLPCRRLPPDRGGGRCDPIRRPWLT